LPRPAVFPPRRPGDAILARRRFLFVLFLGWQLAGCGGGAGPPVELPLGTSVGDRAPELTGILPGGRAFQLDPAGAAHTVLLFYRSAQCGLCRLQLEQAQHNLDAYRRQGARIVALTLDPPELSQALLVELPLQFDLVSVPRSVFVSWDAVEPASGVPLPATFVLDRAGRIEFRHIGRNAADRTTDAGLLTLLQAITEP
jgi:peroxiredoxin